jgi:Domain of unknown function (DUF4169)
MVPRKLHSLFLLIFDLDHLFDFVINQPCIELLPQLIPHIGS